ncbi:hypothetical protein ACFQX4_26915 [Roseomonas sp. GCM10028921]
MIDTQHQPITAASTTDDGPGEPTSFSSPPCFLHELDPSYFGYLEHREVRGLLTDLLRAELSGTRVENAWAHAMLLRQAVRLDSRTIFSSPEPSRAVKPEGTGSLQPLSLHEQERLKTKLVDALPRLHDRGLRQDLEQILRLLKRERSDGERRSNG